MNVKKNLILHQKSKSINSNLTLKDIVSNNALFPGNIQPNDYFNYYNDVKLNTKTNNTNEESQKINKEIQTNHNINNTIEDKKQNVLDIYYDKNSSFKNKIDNLNLEFYLETEKYLNYNKTNDKLRCQKLQANLFIILFKQINIFIEEIERLNKLIIENKYKKETIVKRTNELNEKKHNILIKDNYIKSLKQSNTITEKKLLEALLHEDKLIKDNERLRKENETYKSLTIVFENELKNSKKKNDSSSPFDKNFIKHIKTYSDYGIPSISTIGDLYTTNTGRCETINYKNKSPLSDKKINDRKELVINNKYRNNLNNKNTMKNKIKKINKCQKNNNIKINNLNNCNQLLRNNTLKENIKMTLNRPSFNTKQKNKKSQDNKKEETLILKNRTKKDFPSLSKFVTINSNNNNTVNNSKNFQNKNKMVNHILPKSNNSCRNRKPINSDKAKKNTFIKNNINNNLNLNLNFNNISSNTHMNMTEANDNSSFEKSKDKNFKKFGTKTGGVVHKKRNKSEISFTETVKVQILNEELNNSLINQANHLQTQTNNKKGDNVIIKKSFSNKFDGKKNKNEKNISIQDRNNNVIFFNNKFQTSIKIPEIKNQKK